jgi:hypothetical protein
MPADGSAQVVGGKGEPLLSALQARYWTCCNQGAALALNRRGSTRNQDLHGTSGARGKLQWQSTHLIKVRCEARRTNAWRSSAIVGDKIGKRDVGLMTNSGEDWEIGGCDRAQHHLTTEGGKVVARATTARKKDHRWRICATSTLFVLRQPVCALDPINDLRGCRRPLDGGVHQHKA